MVDRRYSSIIAVNIARGIFLLFTGYIFLFDDRYNRFLRFGHFEGIIIALFLFGGLDLIIGYILLRIPEIGLKLNKIFLILTLLFMIFLLCLLPILMLSVNIGDYWYTQIYMLSVFLFSCLTFGSYIGTNRYLRELHS